jgi:hypothetical protein
MAKEFRTAVANSFLGVAEELVSPLDKEIWLRGAGERMRLAQSGRKRRQNFKLRHYRPAQLTEH